MSSSHPKQTPSFVDQALQPLSAQDARRIARASLRGPEIQPILTHVYTRIRQASERGETHLFHPLEGVRVALSDEQRAAIWDALRAQGYNVERAGTEISWRDAT